MIDTDDGYGKCFNTWFLSGDRRVWGKDIPNGPDIVHFWQARPLGVVSEMEAAGWRNIEF